MNIKTEIYHDPISVEFSGLPSINLVSVILEQEAKWYQRIAEATRRRYFTLEKDWKIKLGNVDYMPGVNGTVTIPKTVNGKAVIFDGASVPMPWLVSFLSLGILRPLGVMLTASIIHDFAYKYGCLYVTGEGEMDSAKLKIERHDIDKLFRDIISTVNRIWFVGWLAWFFVRIGWFVGVKYNGQSFKGKAPVIEGVCLLLPLLFVGFLLDGYGSFDRAFQFFVTFVFLLYGILSLVIYFVLFFKNSRIE